jgi:hypothetical protein
MKSYLRSRLTNEMRADRSYHNREQAKNSINNNYKATNISLNSRRYRKENEGRNHVLLVRPSEVNLTTSSENVRQSCTESEKLYLSF